jgi:hypothetical protein
MPDSQDGQITQLLDAASRGEEDAHQTLWTLIYDELHSLAQRQMSAEAPGRTMQATALSRNAE